MLSCSVMRSPFRSSEAPVPPRERAVLMLPRCLTRTTTEITTDAARSDQCDGASPSCRAETPRSEDTTAHAMLASETIRFAANTPRNTASVDEQPAQGESARNAPAVVAITLSAAETHEHREHVTDHREERRGEHEPVAGDRARRRRTPERRTTGTKPLAMSPASTASAIFAAEQPKRVRRPEIPAPVLSQIDPAEDPPRDVAERDRTREVAHERHDDDDR